MAALFKIVCTWNVNGQPANPFVNVFGYRSNIAVINEEQELSNAFKAQMAVELIKPVSASVQLARIEVYNVSNGTGYLDYNYPAPLAGLRTSGDNMPLFCAWGFQYNRLTAGKRNGSKRFGLITEADVAGTLPTAGMQVILDALAVKLGSPLKVGIIDTWFPEILERKTVGVYPWTSHPILNVTFKRVTTQNSRKR